MYICNDNIDVLLLVYTVAWSQAQTCHICALGGGEGSMIGSLIINNI